MAVVALHSAATGLGALSTKIDVIANNLANVNTTAFKSSRVNFEDLLYQEMAQPGVENANGDQRPAGLFVGLGVRISNTDLNFTQGSPIQTDQPYDLMIDGDGFFAVDILDSEGGGVGYTRSGNFFKNSDGELVLGSQAGPRLIPPVVVPDNTTSIDVTADGRVIATLAGETDQQELAQIQLTTFVNPRGLKPVGGNIFVETPASGTPITGNPGDGSLGTMVHKFLEASNVDPVKELVELIKTQRAFELNSQSIQAADQSLQVVTNLRRF
jgi:flagellar basal-body rod protein FlgG